MHNVVELFPNKWSFCEYATLTHVAPEIDFGELVDMLQVQQNKYTALCFFS